MITFERRKEDCLKKNDKSSINGIDKPIETLCSKINKNKNYYTLSSCSGRVVLLRNLEKKQPNMFVFRSHTNIKFEELKKALEIASKNKETLIFKQEPPILAIACKDLEAASMLLDKAREKAGWKNSGIMGLKGRIICELRSTEYLALPIMEKGELLVEDDFIKILIRESNNRMKKGWKKIERLEKEIFEN